MGMLKKRDHVTFTSDTMDPQPVTPTSPTRLAYLAGLFDGEGCIYIYKGRPRPSNGEVNFQYMLGINIVNTDDRIITIMKEVFGFGYVKKEVYGSRRRQVWYWTATRRKAEEALKQLYPYLIIKKEQAKFAIIFMNTYRIRRHRKSPPEVLEIRQKLKDKISWLKQRPPHINIV